MILAQASYANADCLITNDQGFIKLASKLYDAGLLNLSVMDIPQDEQLELDI